MLGSEHIQLNKLSLPFFPTPLKNIFEEKLDVFSKAGNYADEIRDAHGVPHNRWFISLLLELLSQSFKKKEKNKIAFIGGWLTHYVVDEIFCAHSGFLLFQPDYKRFKIVHDLAECELAKEAISSLDLSQITIPENYGFWDYYEKAFYQNILKVLEIEKLMQKKKKDKILKLIRSSMKDCIVGLVILFRYFLISTSTRIKGDLKIFSKDGFRDIGDFTKVVISNRPERKDKFAAVKIACELSRESNCKNGGKWSDPLNPNKWLTEEENLKNSPNLKKIVLMDTAYSQNEIEVKGESVFLKSQSLKDMVFLADLLLDKLSVPRYGKREDEKLIFEKWRGRIPFLALRTCEDGKVPDLAWGRWKEESLKIPMFNSEVTIPKSMSDYIKFFEQSGMIDWSNEAQKWFKNKYCQTFYFLHRNSKILDVFEE